MGQLAFPAQSNKPAEIKQKQTKYVQKQQNQTLLSLSHQVHKLGFEEAVNQNGEGSKRAMIPSCPCGFRLLSEMAEERNVYPEEVELLKRSLPTWPSQL
ncbi:hypothetical protein P8452_27664 [Trifolium repens]|nr:hypothetical protein P8452_27664 [Trifolium repens]